MGRFWKKVDDELLGALKERIRIPIIRFRLKGKVKFVGSPIIIINLETKRRITIQVIKKYDFSSLEQIEEIKKELLGRKILIINAQELLKNVDVTKLKRGIEDLKSFLRENGGSMARLGDQYLILTPNSAIKIAN